MKEAQAPHFSLPSEAFEATDNGKPIDLDSIRKNLVKKLHNPEAEIKADGMSDLAFLAKVVREELAKKNISLSDSETPIKNVDEMIVFARKHLALHVV